MQPSAVSGTAAETSDAVSEIQRVPTPPDSGRSFYSATAQTVSGHQTDRTAFFTPESSPEHEVIESSQPPPEHEYHPALVFPDPIRSLSMDPAEDDLLAPSFESAPRSGGLEACEQALWARRGGPFYRVQGAEGDPDNILPEVGWSGVTEDEAPTRKASMTGDVAHQAPVLAADGMSEAYELIPGPDSPTSSRFCFEASGRISDNSEGLVSHLPKHGYFCRDDSLVCEVPLYHNADFFQVPDAVARSPAPHVLQQNLVATEPEVSMAPPIFISSPSQQSSAFSSVDEARESIPRLSSLLLQLQHLHGDSNLDVLLTCFRLASAHHFVKNLLEARTLFKQCLHMSVRYERAGIFFLRMRSWF